MNSVFVLKKPNFLVRAKLVYSVLYAPLARESVKKGLMQLYQTVGLSYEMKGATNEFLV